MGIEAVGDLWYAGKVSVSQEHFTSGMAVNRMEALILAVPQPTREQTVLIGCPAGELHTFPALLLTLLLRRRGWKVVNLGADVPADQLVETSLALSPDVVGFDRANPAVGCHLEAYGRTTRSAESAGSVRRASFQSGTSFARFDSCLVPGRKRQRGCQHIAQLASDHAIFPAQPTVNVSLAAVTRVYQEKRLVIEAALVNQMNWNGLEIQYIHVANSYFNRRLTAALELGSPGFWRTIWSG